MNVFGKYQACERCGDTRVKRAIVPAPEGRAVTLSTVEWVRVTCLCGRQRARYSRRKGKARI